MGVGLVLSKFSLVFRIMTPFRRVSLALAIVVSSIIFALPVAAQSSGSSLQRLSRSWGGKYVSRDVEQGSVEIVIYSGRVVYAKWDRVAGCNLDPKRSECSLVEQSVLPLHPCSLLWTVPFEDNSIQAPARQIVLTHEFCDVGVNE